MTSALVTLADLGGSPELSSDLEAVGIHVLGAVSRGNLVQEAVRSSPDLVICYDDQPGDSLFKAAASLRAMAPRPMVVFTSDPDADKIEAAARSGIDAYVINGYGMHRLRSVIHLAQARFRYEQVLREELTDVSNRFEERKLVDRAKGILMRARQISEDDAFRLLRTASMQANARLGAVSRQVIDSARYAESVNRAGQLRMLSQRVVKLHALRVAGVSSQATGAAASQGILADSVERVERNLAILKRSLSASTFGDLIEAVQQPWAALAAALAEPLQAAKLPAIDRLAETVLEHADRLTLGLESAGMAATLHVINVSGRQRMLSQRYAKELLLAQLLQGPTSVAALTASRLSAEQLSQALGYLDQLPLSSASIRETLAQTHSLWKEMQAVAAGSGTPKERERIAVLSESLLEAFERLTDLYERSMQALMG